MRKICTLSAFLFFTSVLTSAEIWTGQLFDAKCVAQHKGIQKYEDCIPAAETASFTLQISGRMLSLDAAGNTKAAAAWKKYINITGRTDSDVKTKPLTATVEGTASGDEIKVDSIQLH